ncbi:hypothetical protein B0H34DRAFT_795461 [Crassisporium funariophilum]|nr:hypothetical protein B0H34DRAFT_795461 [Crassisporium funariophilum]
MPLMHCLLREYTSMGVVQATISLFTLSQPRLVGFPVDIDQIIGESHKTVPQDSDGIDRIDSFCRKYFSKLYRQCGDIWSSPAKGIEPVLQESGPMYIMVIVASTRPDEGLLPPPKRIEELRKVVAALGLTENRGWFTGWISAEVQFTALHIASSTKRSSTIR